MLVATSDEFTNPDISSEVSAAWTTAVTELVEPVAEAFTA
jgi:hypothetical protein